VSPPFALAYRPTRADAAALLAPARRIDVAFDLRWFLAACVAAGMGLGLIEDGTRLTGPTTLAAAGAIVALFLAGGALWRALRRRRAVARFPLPREARARIDAVGVELIEDGRERFVAWETVAAVTGDDARVMLRLDPVENSVVLPRAAFADAAEMAAFRAYADARIEASADELAEPPPDAPHAVDIEIAAGDARRLAQGEGRRLTYAQAMGAAALIGALGLGGLAFLLAKAFGVEAGFSPWLAGAALGAGLGAAGLGLRFDRAQARRWRDWRPVRARLVIDPQGLTRRAEGVETRLDWRAVERIESRPDDLLIWLSNDEALPAPRRCFADESEFARFAHAARVWRRAALDAPAPKDAPP
jgi:hypothetical protein